MCEGSIKTGKRVKCTNPGMFSGCIGEVVKTGGSIALVKFHGINNLQRVNFAYLEVLS